MSFQIRVEKKSDICQVYELIKLAFNNEDPARLAEMLRRRKEFMEGLSLVAELRGHIVGHILFSKVHIQTQYQMVDTLWLEPISVHPAFQKKGIGSALIRRGIQEATEMGFKSMFVLGAAAYYCRFGFKEAGCYGIESSLSVPPEAFLVMELKENELGDKSGKFIYPQEIFG